MLTNIQVELSRA